MGSFINMNKSKRILCFVISFCLIFCSAFTVICFAEKATKTVRVGWYDTPFNRIDKNGRRCGYAYDYEQKVAAYTGWKYEYVNGSWPELFQMLKDGEIDILSDVSYTSEREKDMLFSTLPMGEEEYYVFVHSENKTIVKDNIMTLNGRKIGVNKGSVQKDIFSNWMKKHNVTAEIVELTCSEEESKEMIKNGKLDAMVSIDAYDTPEYTVPLFNIGFSDFYFAINKNRPDLLSDIEYAMNKIQQLDRFYNQKLYEKYIKNRDLNLWLDLDEIRWLSQHGKIRVGYQDNYLAFCAADKSTGELTGALKDYLSFASGMVKNTDVEFEAIAYPTSADALQALNEGKVDCVFPVNLTDYDGEQGGFLVTSSLMRTDMYAVVPVHHQHEFFKKEDITVAVNEGNPNYDMFLVDNFPEWNIAYYKDTPECLKKISKGEADCLLISSFRFSNISDLCNKYHLTTVSTGVNMDYCMATARDNTTLFSILSKIISNVPDSVTHAALSVYYTEDSKPTVAEFIKEHFFGALVGFAVIASIIIILLLFSLHAKKKAIEGRKIISETEIDDITGLYNKNFFYHYAEKIFRDNPSVSMDVISLNVERFRSLINSNGEEFSNKLLSELGAIIREFLDDNGGIAGRFELDNFAIYCYHVKDYDALFERFNKRIEEKYDNIRIGLYMGVMPWQEGTQPAQMYEQAYIACLLARRGYRQRVIIFDESVRKREEYERRLLNDLHRAIEEEQFKVYYQPKYSIQGSTPVLEGAEALVRWVHPELGLVPPCDFIELFERNGTINVVDKYVWEQAAKQAALWRDKFGRNIPVSINISRMDLFDKTLEKTLDGLLEKYNIDHSLLKLEITESAYTDNENQLLEVVKTLKNKGYRIEMDDFGAGYSSLNMLSSMPVDVLKMDGKFINNVKGNENDTRFIELILNIAKNLKIQVIAEGVETQFQFDLLKNLGCDMIQGFYFSPAVPADEFEEKIINKDFKN